MDLIRQRRAADVTETESELDDPKCEKQKDNFADFREKLKSGATRLEETHEFTNESKFTLALAWAGTNDDGTLLVLTTESHFIQGESTLWRSTNHGREWANCSDKVGNEKFRKDDGLQRNPHDPKKVYLISYERYIYVTEDGGKNWAKRMLINTGKRTSLTLDEPLEFHPDPDFDTYVASISNDRDLYVSYDNFQTEPKMIRSNVHFVKWGTKASHTEKNLFAVTGDFKLPFLSKTPEFLSLECYDPATNKWTALLQRVVLFNVQGKFMYATTYKSKTPTSEEDEKLMLISNDGGKTWNEAQLPTVTGDRFFSVLDMSQDLIFMHVDNPGDTGHGTLYTSSSNGVIFSKSLAHHLFPNYNTVHDFYPVKSIRGVYLASQMNDDKSIHTVITYNQGGEWKQVPKPLDAKCEDGKQESCSLQIHNAYSIHRGIKARLPHSLERAYGLVLIHGNVAHSLQTTPPDVYLSIDGGYGFKRVLRGPHAYEIADSGGLLVAVSLATSNPNVIKFSTDEGNCWHTYQFTKDDITFTGLLTEPGGKSMTVSVWGYHSKTKKWTVNVIDFNLVISRQCTDDDYIQWTPHISYNTNKGYEGCLLGQKETFNKIKKDSWCKNGYNKHMTSIVKTCPCTKDDYECDFGFYRPVGSQDCVRQPDIQAKEIDICKGDHLEKLVSVGYRLIPGDKCDPTNGFKPSSQLISLDLLCNSGDKTVIKEDMTPPKKSVYKKMLLIVVLVAILVVLAVLGAVVLYKMVWLRRHKAVYRYSMLNQNDQDNDFENALTNHDSLYKDSSDEEVEEENRSPQRDKPKNGLKTKVPVRGYHDDSDDDMLG